MIATFSTFPPPTSGLDQEMVSFCFENSFFFCPFFLQQFNDIKAITPSRSAKSGHVVMETDMCLSWSFPCQCLSIIYFILFYFNLHVFLLSIFISLRGRRKKGREKSTKEGKGKVPSPLSPTPLPFSLFPYPLPVSTPATQDNFYCIVYFIPGQPSRGLPVVWCWN